MQRESDFGLPLRSRIHCDATRDSTKIPRLRVTRVSPRIRVRGRGAGYAREIEPLINDPQWQNPEEIRPEVMKVRKDHEEKIGNLITDVQREVEGNTSKRSMFSLTEQSLGRAPGRPGRYS